MTTPIPPSQYAAIGRMGTGRVEREGVDVVSNVNVVGRTPASVVKPLVSTPQVELFEQRTNGEMPLGKPGKAGDPVAREAYANAVKVDAFLRTSFGRNGWDNKGSSLKLVVHATDELGKPMNNAYWDSSQGKVYLGDGDGKVFSPLGGSLDVLTHETVHAVVDSEVNLRYSGQQGGVNESWADVLATIADPKDWLIGEDVFTPGKEGDAIRDLEKPNYGHFASLPKDAEVGVHDLSGIPSLAAVTVAKQIGRDDMGKIWYRALTEHLDSRSGYAGAARATLRAAEELFGQNSAQFSAVNDAWRGVGVRSRFKA